MLLRTLFFMFRPLYSGGVWFRCHFSSFGATIFYCAFFTAIIGLDAKSNLSSLIFSLACSIFLFSFLFCLFFRPRVSIKRDLPEFVTAGEKFFYTIRFTTDKNKHLNGLSVCDQLKQPFPNFTAFKHGYAPSNLSSNPFDRSVGYYKWIWILRHLRGGDSVRSELDTSAQTKNCSVKLSFTPVRRGMIYLSGIKLFRPDPFGLCFATKIISCTDSLLVLPKRYDVPHISLPGSSPIHQPGGIPFSSSIGESDEFSSLREYRPGDSFRGIHWKSWAKTGKLIVKETHPEFFIRNALILDTIVNPEKHEIFEEAVSVATSFLCKIDTQESLLDLIFVGDKPYNFSMGRGLGTPSSMLKVLACAKMASDKNFDALACAVLKNSALFSGCILVLCDFNEQRRALHASLIQAKIKVMTLVITTENIENKPKDVITLNPNNIQEGLSQL